MAALERSLLRANYPEPEPNRSWLIREAPYVRGPGMGQASDRLMISQLGPLAANRLRNREPTPGGDQGTFRAHDHGQWPETTRSAEMLPRRSEPLCGKLQRPREGTVVSWRSGLVHHRNGSFTVPAEGVGERGAADRVWHPALVRRTSAGPMPHHVPASWQTVRPGVSTMGSSRQSGQLIFSPHCPDHAHNGRSRCWPAAVPRVLLFRTDMAVSSDNLVCSTGGLHGRPGGPHHDAMVLLEAAGFAGAAAVSPARTA